MTDPANDVHDARRAHPRPPWIVWLGLAVVLAAAAVLSFAELRSLGIAVRIPETIAWLLPISIDAGAAVSCAIWLGGRTDEHAARYAGRMTWALLTATVLGNATAQGMASANVTPPWWVAVLVGAIPPAIVGSTVHLVVLLRRTVADQTAETADRTPLAADRTAGPQTVQAWIETRPDRQTGPADHPDRPDRTALTTSVATVSDLRTHTTDHRPASLDQERTAGPTDDEIADRLREWTADPLRADPTRNAVMREFSIGTGRATKLLARHLDGPDRTDDASVAS